MARRAVRRRLWLAGAGLVAIVTGAVLFLRTGPPRDEAAARARLATRRPAPAELNVVVVTLDTLRADRLGKTFQ